MEHERSDTAPPIAGRAFLIDPSVRGQSHLLVNTGYIDLALQLYRNVTVVAHHSHVVALTQYMGEDRAARIRFVGYDDAARIVSIYREETKTHSIDRVIFLNIDNRTYYRINLLNMAIGRRTLYWVAHSHFVTFGKRGYASMLKNRFKKSLLLNSLFKSKIIVCGQNIKLNVDALLGEGGKVKAVFHPVGIDPLPAKNRADTMDHMSLLHINGWHEPGADKLATVKAIEDIASGKNDFTFCDVKSGVSTDQGERRFLRDYRDRLKIIADYAYFLHLPEDPYRLQASGAVMDMLLTGTPVIGLKTEFGEELRNLIGHFGHFFDSYFALITFLRNADPAALLADRTVFVGNLQRGYDMVKKVSLQHARAALCDA